ncbi:hypothetical protein BGW41_004971 [Actinomortierella wolfii]|nr:hypothetical protein BGW41_004971 [Actinomortierella wolfii]
MCPSSADIMLALQRMQLQMEEYQQQMVQQQQQMVEQQQQMAEQQQQMAEQQRTIQRLESELGDNEGRVVFKNSRATMLRLYDELLEHYPAIGHQDFFNSELPKDHDLFDWSDFHFTEGMEYKAPPVLEHSEVSLPKLAKQHDQDLATVQGFLANTTRMYDTLAHELITLGVADSELGARLFNFLNIARYSAANDASRISRMRSDIYYAALGIKVSTNKEKPLHSLEDIAAKKAAAELVRKTYKKPDPPKDKFKKFSLSQGRGRSNSGDKSKDRSQSKGSSSSSKNSNDDTSSGYKRYNKTSDGRRNRSRSRTNTQRADQGKDGEISD